MNIIRSLYKTAIVALLFVIATGFSYQELNYAIRNSTIKKGEKLTFRLHYGLLTAGYPVMQVFDKTYPVDGKTCFKVEVSGKTYGAVHKLFQIKDIWRSYMDTANMLPKYAYRNISEGNYKLVENTYLNRGGSKTKVVIEKTEGDKTKEYATPEGIHDIVSGFFYYRNIDYSKKSIGEKIPVKSFFDGELYHLNVVYKGKVELKTAFGRIDCFKLSPEVPENELFDGENSVLFYITADNNRMPVKIKADMFVGSVEMDISEYQNLRHSIKFK